MKIVLFLLISFIYAQEAAITNLQVAQRTDGSKLVDITYDLGEDALFTAFNVQVEVSFDGGEYWQATYYVEGDVYNGVIYGEGKTIIWYLGYEHPDTFNDNVQVRLTATGTIAGPSPFEMVEVPAGDYTYGHNDEIRNIDYDYQISKYPITNAEYVAFLIEAYALGLVWIYGGRVEGFYAGDEEYELGNYDFYILSTYTGSHNYGRIAWNGTTFVVPEGYGSHPVIAVTWFGAYAFAQYYGLRLPDEYEWEKAARGNTGYQYPWGNGIDGSNANYSNSGDPYEQGSWFDDPQTSPVGFYNGQNYEGFQTTDSPSPYGAYDMAGNVFEWTHSWLNDWSSRRVMRGGSWGYNTASCTSYTSGYGTIYPSYADEYHGFRVAKTTN